MFFSGQITNLEYFFDTLLAFVAFSLSASAIYVLNDSIDIEEDRLHPTKKFRPLASGAISQKNAFIMMILFFILGITLMGMLSLSACSILCAYVAINIGYSLYLKRFAVVDVSIIATGFVLRLLIGSTITETPLSMWIVTMTFLLALFLALAKRRDDVLIFLNTGKKMRKVVDNYTLKLIDGALMIMAIVVIVTYILYTTSIEVLQRMQSDYLYLTTIFVILGILRYLQISFDQSNSASPTRIIYRDKSMQLTILLWILSFVWIIYL